MLTLARVPRRPVKDPVKPIDVRRPSGAPAALLMVGLDRLLPVGYDIIGVPTPFIVGANQSVP
jgi:hypothetical protein